MNFGIYTRGLWWIQIANPKTLVMQYIELFSHFTAQLPVGGKQINIRGIIGYNNFGSWIISGHDES